MKISRQEIAAVEAVCEALNEDDEPVLHDLMSRVSDKWSLWTLSVLAEADGPLRFSRVLEGVGEISQKSLTKTLRQLERDGLVTRTIFPEVPPRVEYALTELGVELLKQVEPLWLWLATNIGRFHQARLAFDAR